MQLPHPHHLGGFGLACAQATTLSSQVFGKGNPRSREATTLSSQVLAKATRGPAPGAHVFEPLHLTPDL